MRREGSQLQQLYESLDNVKGNGAWVDKVLLNDRNKALSKDILVAELGFCNVRI